MMKFFLVIFFITFTACCSVKKLEDKYSAYHSEISNKLKKIDMLSEKISRLEDALKKIVPKDITSNWLLLIDNERIDAPQKKEIFLNKIIYDLGYYFRSKKLVLTEEQLKSIRDNYCNLEKITFVVSKKSLSTILKIEILFDEKTLEQDSTKILTYLNKIETLRKFIYPWYSKEKLDFQILLSLKKPSKVEMFLPQESTIKENFHKISNIGKSITYFVPKLS